MREGKVTFNVEASKLRALTGKRGRTKFQIQFEAGRARRLSWNRLKVQKYRVKTSEYASTIRKGARWSSAEGVA
eukprot:6855555-Prymnesium_polylepis.1